MKRFTMYLSAIMLACLLIASPVFADDDNSASTSGNFNINTFAVGGGVDLHGSLITQGAPPISGAAGGISAAGGVGFGAAQGGFESFKIFCWDIPLGEAGATLSSTGGGEVLTGQASNLDKDKVEALFTEDPEFDKAKGVGSNSHAVAVTAGNLTVNAKGLAYSTGVIGGAAGQFTADGSIVGPSPLVSQWKSNGISAGVAAQGSVGGFIGGAGTFGYGDADIGADITMNGWTGSTSYRAIKGDTEIMGTNVSARTMVVSNSHVDTNMLAAGFVGGGWVAGGVAKSGTVQTTDYGFANAGAFGTYSGSGNLGSSFNGSAIGFTQTTATQTPGYRGTIMTSSAGMQVSSSSIPQTVD